MLRRNISRPIRSCSPKLTYYETPVKQNLAMSPSQMAQMVERGIPVSNQLLDAALFDDGSNTNTFSVDILSRRGVDMAEIWTAQQESKSKFKQINVELKNS